MEKSKFKKIFVVALFFAVIGTISILNVPQAKADSSPSITVLSPNGVETWSKGSTQTIKWNTTGNISNVSILLVPVNESVGVRTLAENVANTGSYSWTIPNCTVNFPCSSNFEIPAGRYYIRISDSITKDGDQSDASFSIVPVLTPTPSITVVSPNGGEVWQAEHNYQIEFKIAEGKKGYIDLLVFPEGSESNHIFNSFFSNIELGTGTFTSNWAIPQNISTGKYIVKVYLKTLPVEGTVIGADTSDAPFSIVAAINQNQPPVISGLKAPTTLKVGEVGTWTINAYDPEKGPLSYSVIWGDGTPGSGGGSGGGFPLSIQNDTTQAATFTHSYAKDGKYTPAFIVTDNGGLSAKTSASVSVGNVITPTPIPFVAIYSVSPLSASEGTTVIINGNGFKSGVSVLFNSPEGPSIKASSVSSNGTKLTFVIPVGFILGTYNVAVTNLDGTSNSNEVSFTVISPTAPSITVLSPNGGEIVVQGVGTTISWNGRAPATDDQSYIYLRLLSEKGDETLGTINEKGNMCGQAMPVKGGMNYSRWWDGKTICTNWQEHSVFPGKYRIGAEVYLENTRVLSDQSDAPFSIVAPISEQVNCMFKGSQTGQKCYAASHEKNDNNSCSGKESCSVDIKRAKGESVTWKSTCGGYAYTIMDGENESAVFNCATVVAPPPKPGTMPTNPPQPIESSIEIINMKYNAKNIVDDKYDSILSELKQLRDTIKEQQNEIKYLRSMANDLKDMSETMKIAINDFITYGVDSNTQKLGAGERAAVINSYKSAFDKLPETETELTDAIKIANGRFPSLISDKAEKQAKEQFIKIYKRNSDLNDDNDNAAIKVMAYGLRQKAENRNLNSEKAGIKIFKAIYGRTPKTTEDWNIMQAITYSGAAR